MKNINFLENANESKLNTLKQRLEKGGIDVSQWGKGKAKTLKHSQKEIESGEAILINTEKGELLRRVFVDVADVFYISPEGKKYHLIEEKQIFKDGRERKRNLGQSVSEKLKVNEDPKEAMIRGIKEELGISGEISLIEKGTDEKILPSPSYPGLLSQYIQYKFDIILNDQQFDRNGYKEEQEDKSTYFIWEEV